VEAWTVVPSTRGRANHPLPELVARLDLPFPALRASVADRQPAEARQLAAGRFSVDTEPCDIDRRHVLVVDDTWTSGGRAQSMAVSLKDAGASAVSILVLSRWLRPEWPTTADFLEANPHRDFDPTMCPVTGAACP
jgi:hypothetical protein